jgi:CTLH/CRA C-terminal to LisH motif domain
MAVAACRCSCTRIQLYTHGAGAGAALAYVRQHFAPFQEAFMPEIKQLMGCMLFPGRPLEETPYRALVAAALRDDATADLVREACGTLAQARAASHLTTRMRCACSS